MGRPEDEELKLFYDRIIPMTRPEELFGLLTGEMFIQLNELKRLFRNFLRTYQVDKYAGDGLEWHMANEVCRKLVELHDEAKERITCGVYGKLTGGQKASLSQMVIKSQLHEYRVFENQIVNGDLCDVFPGEYTTDDGVIEKIIFKMVRESQDNDLMINEKKVLEKLIHRHLPVLIEQFTATNGKICSVFRKFEGYDFYQVLENPRYKNGVPEKHLVWMMGRALSGLGFAHSNSIVHGYINPSHFLLRRSLKNVEVLDHGLCILDWCYAAIDPKNTGAHFKFYDEIYSAPEVANRLSPVPSSDIYSLGKVMILLSGGDPQTNKMPDSMDPSLKAFIGSMVLESRLQRPRDAWMLHRELEVLRTRLWGEGRYLEFKW